MPTIGLNLWIHLLNDLSIDCSHALELCDLVLLGPGGHPDLVHLGGCIRSKVVHILGDPNSECKHLFLQSNHVISVHFNSLVESIDKSG